MLNYIKRKWLFLLMVLILLLLNIWVWFLNEPGKEIKLLNEYGGTDKMWGSIFPNYIK